MITLKRASVKEIKKERPGYIEAVVDVEGEAHRAICYSSIIGDIKPGDSVIVNTTAVDLDLGTGGFHFILWNLSKDSVNAKDGGHIMKLRYTPFQIKCLAVEEEQSKHHKALKDAEDIRRMPVIIGTLHSQLPAAAAVFKELQPKKKIAYIMTDGASLPIAFSNIVADLLSSNIVDSTITVGHAFGGDYEAINIYSGLVAARYAADADVAIVCMGPGIVGSNTKLGFSGIEQGQIINAVNSLKGYAIAIPRISFADKRKRHYGISHHTMTALKIAAISRAIVTIPKMDEEKTNYTDIQVLKEEIDKTHKIERIDARLTLDVLKKRGLSPTTMGRTVEEEPEFFMAAGAAAIYAARILSGGKSER
ncbi:MAG: DUF3866 family protein [Firmicutes bacterium]|nr:DUF3866 family protein [Bacillota bacterium]